LTQNSDPGTHNTPEPPVAVIILVCGTAEAAIQLFENVLAGESNVLIVAHVSKPFRKERLKILAWARKAGASVIVNEKCLYTRHGFIAHAIVDTVGYALANSKAQRFLLLPFNCVKLVSGFGEEARRGPFRHNAVPLAYGRTDFTIRCFRRALSGRRALYRRFGSGRICKGQHEGVVFDRDVARTLAAVKLPQSQLFYDLTFLISRSTRKAIFLFPYAYEELLVPTAVAMSASEDGGSPGNKPLCFLDWARKTAPPSYEELPWVEVPGEAFFYKWVSIDSENENRRSLFQALPLARRPRLTGKSGGIDGT
jgi:hypothetical protein